MDELLSAFALGNAAILTNACLLPLYPGIIALLAGRMSGAGDQPSRRTSALLGLVVLAGVLTAMVIAGAVLVALRASLGSALTVLLPLAYLVAITLGVLMLTGRNPFARMGGTRVPLIRHPAGMAYAYGLLLGPMTLPCAGPVVLSAFALGTGSTGSLVEGLLYFAAFGLGFGWPMAALPILAMPIQRRMVGWLARNHDAIERGSGVLLVGVGIFGILTELLPALSADVVITLEPAFWLAYWAVVAVLAVATGVIRARRAEPLPS